MGSEEASALGFKAADVIIERFKSVFGRLGGFPGVKKRRVLRYSAREGDFAHHF